MVVNWSKYSTCQVEPQAVSSRSNPNAYTLAASWRQEAHFVRLHRGLVALHLCHVYITTTADNRSLADYSKRFPKRVGHTGVKSCGGAAAKYS